MAVKLGVSFRRDVLPDGAIFALALSLAIGCADETDTRPETADYIIEAILAPTCGRAACHSSDTKAHGYAFDTIDGAIAAMTSTDRGQKLVVPGSPESSELSRS